MDITKIRALIEANQERTKKKDEESASKKPAGKEDTTPSSSSSNPDKSLPPVKGKNTMTGEKANEVDIEPGLYPEPVEEGRTAVVTFGRMNPPTVGHARLVETLDLIALHTGGTPLVYLSHSHDSKKNPLVYESKVLYARYAFGDTIVESEANDIMAIATEVAESYDNLIFVCGSDRVAEYTRKLNHYNGKLYEFKSIQVHSLDRTGTGSATELRESALDGDFAAFKALLAKPLRYFAEQIYAEVRGEINELNTAQRAKRAVLFKRNKPRVEAGLRRARARRAPSGALMKRARRLAIKNMRKRILRGTDYGSLSYAQRTQVDQRLKKRKKSIGKMAKRLLPKVARAEASRKLGSNFKSVDKVHEQLIEQMLTMIPEAEYDYELSEKEILALEQKAEYFGTTYDLLETVFRRGVAMWENVETDMTFNQYGFGRVNSFLNGGKAYTADFDLVVEDCDRVARHDEDGDGKTEALPQTKKLGTHPRQKKSLHQLMKQVLESKQDVPNLEGGMGKRRVDLPQLTNFDAFHKDLTDSGHKLYHDFLVPSTLTPTQKHFNQEKVDKLKENGWGDKGIIVSDDDYVIDGHHRWLAAHQKGEKIKARRTSLNCDDLLDFVKDKPYVESKKLSESKE